MNRLPHLSDQELADVGNALRLAAEIYCKHAADLALPPKLREQFARQERDVLKLADRLEEESQELEPIDGLYR